MSASEAAPHGPQLLIVFCVSFSGKIDNRLLRRPSYDPATPVVENVVVKHDQPLTGFMRDDHAGYRDVAHFVNNGFGFIHILRCVFNDSFDFSSF